MSKEKIVQTIGKRKESVAKAFVKKGTGLVKINRRPLNTIKPEMVRMMIDGITGALRTGVRSGNYQNST